MSFDQCLFSFMLGLSILLAASAAEPSGKLTAEKVRQLQTKYRQERSEAEKKELTKKFSPEWYEQAAKLAKQGEEALASGRLVKARASFRARAWDLPTMPPHTPAPHRATSSAMAGCISMVLFNPWRLVPTGTPGHGQP